MNIVPIVIRSRYTSIKTRIETVMAVPRFDAVHLSLATLPSKQGLKLSEQAEGSGATGLSLHFHQNKDWNRIYSLLPTRKIAISRYTSIKTRIETCWRQLYASSCSCSRYTSIKTRIETYYSDHNNQFHLYLSLHFHQNKDWNLKLHVMLWTFALNSRYTSIKTRIETERIANEWPSVVLSLHFHQNKDWNLCPCRV